MHTSSLAIAFDIDPVVTFKDSAALLKLCYRAAATNARNM
jgi:hypothetical protein